MVPKSELTAAGVDLSAAMLNNLNDFDARRDEAGANADAIDAQESNAKKITDVLAANLKTFTADAAMAINSEAGVTKQFTNKAAGEYALISLAYDTYNTCLSVSLVTVP